ncbi:MAG TPA: twin-arginine translocase subunit TatC [Ktedonobacteraceae bacterium]|jgi:sec-independent protein translocase protein TatC|nr:twin-arginine translocase subunit TatC [Ktedonobacteraceae bacterium]
MATGNLNRQESALEYEEDLDGATMSLVDHLEELRWRIFKSLIAIAVMSIIAFIFRTEIIKFLAAPLPKMAEQLTHGQLVVTGIMEGFTVMLLVSIAVGVVLALPVILYQAWAFISPGLYQHEKKYAVPFIFIGLILFAMGVSLGYFVLRYPIEFLVTFAASSFVELVTANSYFTFVAFFILAFGLVFEIPLVLTFLAKVGLVSGETLKRKRATMHIGMWIAATVLTPGADIYSPIFLGVAMSFLYELSIIFIKYFVKPETS